MKKLIISLCLLSNISFAQEAAAIALKKAEPAPFDGVLLNKKAAAQVMTFMEESETRCNLAIDEIIEIKAAQCNAEKSILSNKQEREISVCNAGLQSKTQQIDLLENKVNNLEIEKEKEWWSGFWVGTATGIIVTGITAGTIYLVK